MVKKSITHPRGLLACKLGCGVEAPNRLMRVCWAVQGIIMDTLYQGLGFRAFPNIQFWNQVFVSLAYLLIVIVKYILHDGLLYMPVYTYLVNGMKE